MPKSTFALAVAAMLALAGYLLASGIGQLLRSSVAVRDAALPVSSLPLRGPAALQVTEDRVQSARPILDRNPFDSTSPRPLDMPSTPEEAGASGAPTCADATPADLARIRRRSATAFEVDNAIVDKVLESQAALMRVTRMVPLPQGRARPGILPFCVTPRTLLGALAFEDGDRILKVNDLDIASPEKALDAYGRLRSAGHLRVQVNRRGRGVSLNFNIP
jgi:hypothetical protein